jgi:hypothetical protein
VLTDSYQGPLGPSVAARFDVAETRNAARVLRATNPDEFADLVDVLGAFSLDPARDLLAAGGNESTTAARLNGAFRVRGWREASYRVTVSSELVLRAPGAPTDVTRATSTTSTYLVDNVKGRVALDVEWHAKDGNLDRDLAAYRALYDSGIIDGAVIVTVTRASLRAWALTLDPSTTKFQTTTVTSLEKLLPRLERGDGGGCPVLVAAVCDRTR